MSQFQKGQSGNPLGRPVGIRDRRAALREALDAHSEALLNAAVKSALEGNTTVLVALLARLIPTVKAEYHRYNISDSGGGPARCSDRVVSAAMSGELPADIAREVIQGITLHERVLESQQMLARLEKLEARVCG